VALVGDRAWTVVADQGQLVASAGADVVWTIEDVPPTIVDLVGQFWSHHPPVPEALPDAAKPIVAHLAALGALRPIALESEATEIGLLFVGDPIESFVVELRERLSDVQLGTASAHGITVVVRTNATLRSLAEQAVELQRRGAPHLLCDLAFHHMLVLGPHVVPGDTACLACLAGRVGTRWGDPAPPPEPAATTCAELAATLVAHWLANRTDPAASLVNTTLTLDLRTLETVRSVLWRVPGCPVCSHWELTGRVDLPWLLPSWPSEEHR
jgi:bacteriocin biosynthesis cyclodehydratase domain-containing protein